MKCGLCWADNPDDAMFCVDCGVMLTAQSIANVPTIDELDMPAAPRNRGVVAVSLLAIASTLALIVLIVVLALDDGDKVAAPAPTSVTPSTTIAPTTTTTAVDDVAAAASAWRSFSATFVAPHTAQPFTSGDGRYAIAAVEDLTARPSDDGSIAGLVLLRWADSQWRTVAGIPWKTDDANVTFEVLGDGRVAHPMVVVTHCCPLDEPRSFVFRVFDDQLLDIATGRSIETTWTELSLSDKGDDFLEYTSCVTGDDITLASGETQFFCDVVLQSRLDVLADESVRSTSTEETRERPEVVYEKDLDITGIRMTQPECDGSYITAVGASVSSSEARNKTNIAKLLKRYPGSSYLRNDQTCDSLWPAASGAPIYIVYFGPYATKSEACDARDLGPKGAYVRPLDDDVAYTTKIYC